MDNTHAAEKWKNNLAGDYNPLVTYYFVNKTLDMSAGKIGVQTARAGQVMLLHESKHSDTLLHQSLSELFEDTFMHGNKSICLKANSNQMTRILTGDIHDSIIELSKELGYPIRLYPVFDIGATEVPTNSLTVIGMTPAYINDIKHIVKKFQLL